MDERSSAWERERWCLHLCLLEAVDHGIDAVLHDGVLHRTPVVVADLPVGHAGALGQIGPHRVDNRHVRELAALDRIRLCELAAFLYNRLRHVVNRLTLRQAQVHVRTRVVVHVEPQILRPPMRNQVLVLVLVAAHVNRVA